MSASSLLEVVDMILGEAQNIGIVGVVRVSQHHHMYSICRYSGFGYYQLLSRAEE
jgi:mannose/fructose-specific phosphotransferase system component IIA